MKKAEKDMGKDLKLFKKIIYILGIAFLVLGIIPLPMVSKISTAAASVVDGKDSVTPKALGMPNLDLSGKDSTANVAEGNKIVSPKPLGLPNLYLSSDINITCQDNTQCASGEVCLNNVCESANVPSPVDCSGHFTECSAACGPGWVTFVVDVHAENGGIECAYDEGVKLPCNNGHCKVDCVGDWGICTGSCDTGGIQTFSITKPAANGGAECDFEDAETRDCEIPGCTPDCVGEWGECEGECGVEGVQTFNVLQAAGPGGEACEFADGATQVCQDAPCQVDCLWTEWSECSATCGSGVQTRSIAVPSANCGAECEGPTFRACNTQTCPKPPSADGNKGTVAMIIPATSGTGDPAVPLIIPVTGLDLGLKLAGIHKQYLFMGLMLLGVTLILEGIDRKHFK